MCSRAIIDAYGRMMVGWRVAIHMKTGTVLGAIEMAGWSSGKRSPGLLCHSGGGSQFTSSRYGEHLADIGAGPSIGSVGDSIDNALDETMNRHYKAERVRGPHHPGP